jgi:hypothetical protein
MKWCLRASNTSRFGSIATSLSRAAVLVLTLLVAIVVYSAPAHALSGSLPTLSLVSGAIGSNMNLRQ